MHGPDYLAAAASLFNAFAFERLIPLLSLMFMGGLFIVVFYKAQARDDFDWSEFLRADNSKLSWGRLAAFICLMTHTWTVFARTVNDKVTIEEMGLYAVTWSGSLVLLQAIEAWKGKP
jgi:hypothetical protein